MGSASSARIAMRGYKIEVPEPKKKPFITRWIATAVKDGRRIQAQNIRMDDFLNKGFLTSGKTSIVRLCEYRGNKKYYAVKYISKKWMYENRAADLVKNEIEILSQISDRYSIHFFGAFDTHSSIGIILEYGVGGTIHTLLEGRSLPMLAAKLFIAELAMGISYLHSVANIVHRDLNAHNLLVSQLGHLKICDFGSAVSVPPMEPTISNPEELFCKVEFAAPELVNEDENAPKVHGYGVDWWAFGCLVYLMLTGLHPFGTLTGKRKVQTPAITYAIKTGAYKVTKSLSKVHGATELLQGTLKLSEQHRFGPSMVQRSSFFKGLEMETLHKLMPPFIPKNVLVEGERSQFPKEPLPASRGTLTREELPYCDFSKYCQGINAGSIASILSKNNDDSEEEDDAPQRVRKAAVKRSRRRISATHISDRRSFKSRSRKAIHAEN